MVELGQAGQGGRRRQLGKMGSDPTAWVAAYTAEDGWHRADSAQRNLEALIGRIDEEPESEPALQRVRQAYEELLQKMAVGFGQALQARRLDRPENALPDAHLPRAGREGRITGRVLPGGCPPLRDGRRAEEPARRERGPRSPTSDRRPADDHPGGDGRALARRVGPVSTSSMPMVRWPRGSRGRRSRTSTGRMKFLKLRVPGAVDIELGKLLQMTSSQAQERRSATPSSSSSARRRSTSSARWTATSSRVR